MDLLTHLVTTPHLLGLDWMDPQWWLDRFGAAVEAKQRAADRKSNRSKQP